MYIYIYVIAMHYVCMCRMEDIDRIVNVFVSRLLLLYNVKSSLSTALQPIAAAAAAAVADAAATTTTPAAVVAAALPMAAGILRSLAAAAAVAAAAVAVAA